MVVLKDSRSRSIAALLLIVGLLVSSLVGAAGWDGRFEQLRFRVSWLFLPGATAIMQAEPLGGGEAMFRVQACTNAAFDLVHKVRDSISARSGHAEQGYQPLHFLENLREGRYRSHVEVSFPDSGPVEITNHQRSAWQLLRLPPGTMDLITAFYVTRGLPLTVGERVEIPVIDNYEPYNLGIEVLGREIRNTYFGERTPTIIIRPQLLTKGIFNRTSSMRIWLTDDDRHIPVHLETRITIGRIVADLVNVSHDPDKAIGPSLFCENK